MRILFVAPYVPSCIRVRSFNLIKALSVQHEIFLLSLLVDDYEQILVEDVRPYCAAIELVRLPKRRAYVNCLRALPTLLPLRVAYYQAPEFVQQLKEMIRSYGIELVHGELIKIVPALAAMQKEIDVPVVYDAVDCVSWFLQQKMTTSHNLLKKALTYSEMMKIRRLERDTLRMFEQVIISSETDREIMQKDNRGGKEIQVIPNSVDSEYFSPLVQERMPNTLIFCAKLDYFPNTQAILFFCEQILPLIWDDLPDVHLTIVGNRPPRPVRALIADRRIRVTGYVPDTRGYLGSAAVALAPLLVAAGSQSKILEALAMETPMVTTTCCSQALGTSHGRHLLVADDPNAYASAVTHLLRTPQFGRQLGRSGRQFVVERYNWSRASARLQELYQTAMGNTEAVAVGYEQKNFLATN